jgi:hypothetical protein
MEEEKQKTPLEHLAGIAGAPSADRINEWKEIVPGGRVSLFALPPDGKIVFVVRGLSGFEMLQIQKSIPQNADNPQIELEIAAVAKAILWTNLTPTGAVDDLVLKKGPAGLGQTLFMKVSELSCFLNPEAVEALSGDL